MNRKCSVILVVHHWIEFKLWTLAEEGNRIMSVISEVMVTGTGRQSNHLSRLRSYGHWHRKTIESSQSSQLEKLRTLAQKDNRIISVFSEVMDTGTLPVAGRQSNHLSRLSTSDASGRGVRVTKE